MSTDSLAIIRNVLMDIEYEKCILFGSRAKGLANASSDYDLLIIINHTLSQPERFAIAAKIRVALARYIIDADVIVTTVDEAEAYRNMPGSVIRHAIEQGILL
jgi:predicted nucleotidyltransferase